MTRTQLKSKLQLTCETTTVEGVEVTREWLLDIITAKIYRTAIVIKNSRESDKGGIKATVGQALALGLITAEQGLTLILTGDKTMLAEVKSKLPSNEKTEEPTEEDIQQAIGKVLAGNGQNDF